MGSSCFRQVSIARWPVSRFTPNPNKQKPTYPTNGQSDPPANGLPYTLLKSATQNFRISEVSKRNNQEVDHANHLFAMQKSLQCGFEQDSTRRYRHQMQSLWKFDFTASKCDSNPSCKDSTRVAPGTAGCRAPRGYRANHLSVLQQAI